MTGLSEVLKGLQAVCEALGKIAQEEDKPAKEMDFSEVYEKLKSENKSAVEVEKKFAAFVNEWKEKNRPAKTELEQRCYDFRTKVAKQDGDVRCLIGEDAEHNVKADRIDDCIKDSKEDVAERNLVKLIEGDLDNGESEDPDLEDAVKIYKCDTESKPRSFGMKFGVLPRRIKSDTWDKMSEFNPALGETGAEAAFNMAEKIVKLHGYTGKFPDEVVRTRQEKREIWGAENVTDISLKKDSESEEEIAEMRKGLKKEFDFLPYLAAKMEDKQGEIEEKAKILESEKNDWQKARRLKDAESEIQADKIFPNGVSIADGNDIKTDVLKESLGIYDDSMIKNIKEIKGTANPIEEDLSLDLGAIFSEKKEVEKIDDAIRIQVVGDKPEYPLGKDYGDQLAEEHDAIQVEMYKEHIPAPGEIRKLDEVWKQRNAKEEAEKLANSIPITSFGGENGQR